MGKVGLPPPRWNAHKVHPRAAVLLHNTQQCSRMIRSFNSHGVVQRSAYSFVTPVASRLSRVTWQIHSPTTPASFPSMFLKIAPWTDIVTSVSILINPFDGHDAKNHPSGSVSSVPAKTEGRTPSGTRKALVPKQGHNPRSSSS